MPAATTPRHTLPIHLTRGQSTLVCLPPGSQLRVVNGSLAVHAGPLILGQVIAARHPTALLQAEEEWQPAEAGATTWLHLRQRGNAPVCVQLIEAPERPSPWGIAWNAAVAWWSSVRSGQRQSAYQRMQ